MNGFIDLRTNGSGVQVDDSFWPSFTDIMTVVVMIFLIATSVLILRNWELLEQIRLTAAAERAAAELAQQTQLQNETAQARLARTERQLALAQLNLLTTQQARDELTEKHSKLEQELVQLVQNNTSLNDQLSTERAANNSLSQQLRRGDAQRSQLKTNLQVVQDKLSQRDAEFAALHANLEELKTQLSKMQSVLTANQLERSQLSNLLEKRDAEVSTLKNQYQTSAARTTALQDEYQQLKAKYDKLVRPARTASGKQVAEIRYRKQSGRDLIELKVPTAVNFQSLSREQLEQELDKLKQSYPDTLYIKIILPEQSGLSYNEAWAFTRELLERYDYYYRDSTD